MLMYLILYISIFLYLLYQSKEDIKDRTVPVIPNYIAIIGISFIYILSCIKTNQIPDYINILCIMIFLTGVCFFKIFSSGDAKAFFVIGLSSAFFPQKDILFHSIDLIFFIFTYIYATLLFASITIIKRKIKRYSWKEAFCSKEEIAYFPYITAGYVITNIMYFILFL